METNLASIASLIDPTAALVGREAILLRQSRQNRCLASTKAAERTMTPHQTAIDTIASTVTLTSARPSTVAVGTVRRRAAPAVSTNIAVDVIIAIEDDRMAVGNTYRLMPLTSEAAERALRNYVCCLTNVDVVLMRTAASCFTSFGSCRDH